MLSQSSLSEMASLTVTNLYHKFSNNRSSGSARELIETNDRLYEQSSLTKSLQNDKSKPSPDKKDLSPYPNFNAIDHEEAVNDFSLDSVWGEGTSYRSESLTMSTKSPQGTDTTLEEPPAPRPQTPVQPKALKSSQGLAPASEIGGDFSSRDTQREVLTQASVTGREPGLREVRLLKAPEYAETGRSLGKIPFQATETTRYLDQREARFQELPDHLKIVEGKEARELRLLETPDHVKTQEGPDKREVRLLDVPNHVEAEEGSSAVLECLPSVASVGVVWSRVGGCIRLSFLYEAAVHFF